MVKGCACSTKLRTRCEAGCPATFKQKHERYSMRLSDLGIDWQFIRSKIVFFALPNFLQRDPSCEDVA